MDFDSILPHLGEFGKYQKLMFIVLCIPACLPCAFTFFNSLFIAATPDHWCTVPELADLDMEVQKNLSLPWEPRNGLTLQSQCVMYDVNYTLLMEEGTLFDANRSLWNTTKCRNGWSFDHTYFDRTIVTDMEIVCDKKWLVGLSETMLFTGGLFGNLFFGWLSDKFGRKKAFILLVISNVTLGIIAAFPPNFTYYIILRGLIGMTVISLYQIPFVLILELMSPEKRCASAMFMSAVFSTGIMLLAFLCWLAKDWFIISLISSVPFVLMLSYWWLLPESPRWLLANDRIEETEEIVQKIARINKKHIPPNFVKSKIIKENVDLKDPPVIQKARIMDIFRYPNIRKRALIVNFNWICNDLVYIGLSYTSTGFGVNPYLSFAITGLVEIPGIFVAWYMMDHLGRRFTLFVFMTATGIFCLLTACLSPTDTIGMLVLNNLGKLGITGSFSVAYMFAGESFPTVLRSIALSTGSITGSAALMVAPQILRKAAEYHRILPIVLMGVLGLLGGIIGTFLPETLGTHLPQTIEEGEKFGENFKYWDIFPKIDKTKEPVPPKKNSLPLDYRRTSFSRDVFPAGF